MQPTALSNLLRPTPARERRNFEEHLLRCQVYGRDMLHPLELGPCIVHWVAVATSPGAPPLGQMSGTVHMARIWPTSQLHSNVIELDLPGRRHQHVRSLWAYLPEQVIPEVQVTVTLTHGVIRWQLANCFRGRSRHGMHESWYALRGTHDHDFTGRV